MEKRAGGLLFWAVTILLITVTAFCCVETAASRTDLTRAELESCYREWERGIAEDIREYLGRQGYENSGVTLTRVTDEDGFREYTVSIHHSSIMEMERMAGESWHSIFRRGSRKVRIVLFP